MDRKLLAATVAAMILLPTVVQAEPFTGTCISCDFYVKFENVATGYATALYDQIATSAKRAMNSAAFLWVVYEVAMYQLNKATPYAELIKRFLIVCFVGVVLNSSTLWLEYVATPIMGTAIDWASFVMQQTGADTGGRTGVEGIMYAAETPAYRIFKPISASWTDILGDLGRLILLVIMFFPWLGYWALIERAVLLSILTSLIITSMAPFFLVCLAFKPTEKVFWAAVKELVLAGMRLVVISVYIGMVNTIMKGVFETFPIDAEGSVTIMQTLKWLAGEAFWAYVFAALTFAGLARYVEMLPAKLLGTYAISVNPQNIIDAIRGKGAK